VSDIDAIVPPGCVSVAGDGQVDPDMKKAPTEVRAFSLRRRASYREPIWRR
jgi:hypothetical protein